MLLYEKIVIGDKVRVVPSKELQDAYGNRGYWKRICECEYAIVDHIDSSRFPFCLNLYDKNDVQIERFIWTYPNNVEAYKTNKKK